MCAFVVLGFVFPYQAKRLAWGTSLKWPILCWVERKTTTQSNNDLGIFQCLLKTVTASYKTVSDPKDHNTV